MTNAVLATKVRTRMARRAAEAALILADAFYRWRRRDRDLRHVLQLDDHLLRDIGLTRDQVLGGALNRERWPWRR
jgi:uncharacterized protein YjiS (DUF1127 family)